MVVKRAPTRTYISSCNKVVAAVLKCCSSNTLNASNAFGDLIIAHKPQHHTSTAVNIVPLIKLYIVLLAL